jgi:hypothetical protein
MRERCHAVVPTRAARKDLDRLSDADATAAMEALGRLRATRCSGSR